MRRSLFAAASILALAAAPAFAQEETIDDTREEPVETATVAGGSPANLIIGASGRVQLTNVAGPAVLVNSDNDLTTAQGSRIEIFDTDANGDDVVLDGAIGVQVADGVTSDITLGGLISLDDTYQATATEGQVDTDDDGTPDTDDPEADGPFAQDRNKTGLLIGAVDGDGDAVPGQAGITGRVLLQSSSSVNVAGQDSYGVRSVADISGDFLSNGSVVVRGERSRAISIEGDVGGDVAVDRITLTSPGGEGAVIEGDVGGGVRISGTINVSGYRIPQRLSAELVRQFEDEDLQNSGSALVIAGSVTDGVFFRRNTDLNQFSGAGSAVDIGRAGETITIGQTQLPDDFLAPSGEEDADTDRDVLDHAIINQGAVRANGIYDGRSAVAFLVAGRDDAGQLRMVILGGDGFNNEGVIEATAYDATATALHFGEGAQADELRNTGQITARSSIGFAADGLNDAIGEYATGAAVALRLDAGSSIRRILNEQGAIVAFLQPGASSGSRATAVLVNSDLVEEIENTGVISASYSGTAPAGLNADRGAQLIAVDASTRTQGLTIRQMQALDGNGDPTETEPRINGDVLFGSGDDVLDLQAGELVGNVFFGDGNDQLILNGASITGSISDSDANLVIDVTNGRIVLSGTESLNLTDATFNEGGQLEIEIDTTARTGAFVNASGAVTFASGSDLSIGLGGLIGAGGDFQIISADQLSIADEAILSTTDAPFLYTANIQRSASDANTLVLSLTRKTAEQLGMNEAQSAAYLEAFAAFGAIESLGAAFASMRSADEFFSGYNQLLPEYSASAIQFALANNDAAAGALAARLRNARLSPDNMAGVWAQEFGYFADRAGGALGPGYRGQGIGLAIGLDRPVGPFYAVGVKLVGSASEIEEVDGLDEPLIALSGQVGTYAAIDLGGFDVSGSLGLGYDFFESERLIQLGNFASVNTAEWSGWHIAASAVAGRDYAVGAWTLRPEASLTVLSLFESGYTESVGDIANAAIALTVEDRQTMSISAAATLDIVRRFGTDQSWWAPHFRLGYRGEFDDSMAETTAQFGDTGSPFTLRSSSVPGSGYLLGMGVSAGSEYSTFTFAYDADVRDGFIRHVGRLVIRLTF